MAKTSILLSLLLALTSLYAESSTSDTNGLITTDKKLSKNEQKNFKKRYNELNNSALKKDMPVTDLQELFQISQKLTWYDEALSCIPYLQKKIMDPKELKKLLLTEADILFLTGNKNTFKKAAEKYKQFIKDYPGSEESEYAYYKAILSLNAVINIPERDQSATQDILELIEDYFSKGYTRYTQELKSLKEKCHLQLYQKEVIVFDHYLDAGKVPAAKQRLACIEQDYASILDQKNSHTLPILKCRLAFAEKDLELYNTLMAQLEKNYNEASASFRLAQAKLEKSSVVNA